MTKISKRKESRFWIETKYGNLNIRNFHIFNRMNSDKTEKKQGSWARQNHNGKTDRLRQI